MIDVKTAASYIYNKYEREKGEPIDEMKLHKLLYLSQREAIVQTGGPMFSAPFEAWKYGPVVVEIRDLYKKGLLSSDVTDSDVEPYVPVFNYVFNNYADKDTWSLSILTHSESSWLNARKGLEPEDHGSKELKISVIRNDAERIKMRRFFYNEVIPQLQ